MTIADGHLGFDSDGHLVFSPDFGHLAFDCGAVNPCVTDSEVLLTVTGAGSVTVNWAGETWNLPADSGLQKSICPINQTRTKRTASLTYPAGAYNATDRETWRGPANGLFMDRFMGTRWVGAQIARPNYLNYNRLGIYNNQTSISSEYKFFKFKNSATSGDQPLLAPPSTTNYGNNRPYILGAVPVAEYSTVTINGHLILPGFFGNKTVAGITYAWAQGAGW